MCAASVKHKSATMLRFVGNVLYDLRCQIRRARARACIKSFPHRVCEIIETQNLANPRFVRGECVALYVTYTLDCTRVTYSSGICLLEDRVNRRASSIR